MKASHFGLLAFTFLVLSISSLLFIHIKFTTEVAWNIIPQLLILLFFISCIGYVSPNISKKGFVICSVSMMLACATHQLGEFWSSTNLLLIGFTGTLFVTGLSNYVYFKYASRD
jgi:hypothetical protein